MAQARITVAQLATRIDAMEERDNETQELLRTLIAATKQPATKRAATKRAATKQPATKQPATKQPADVTIITVTEKFPPMAEIEKALLPGQCQRWSHAKHDSGPKAKDSYIAGMPSLIIQCSRAKCKHVDGYHHPGMLYAGSEGYYAERAKFHKRWRAEFGPVNEKAGK